MVVRGVSLARSGDTTKARTELEAARQIVPDLVATNIAALDGRAIPIPAIVSSEAELKIETIAAAPAKEAFTKSADRVSFTLSPAEKGEATISIHSRSGKEWDSIAVEMPGRRIGTLATSHTYKGSSANGVKIGSPLAAVGQLYGIADRIVPSRQGAWYLFNMAGIVFEINDLGRVAGWFIVTLR
jgi:hypothetical protein